jgi:hypothetical protein
MIVGGLVIVVGAILFFGTDLFRSGGDGDKDINVRIEAPAAAD